MNTRRTTSCSLTLFAGLVAVLAAALVLSVASRAGGDLTNSAAVAEPTASPTAQGLQRAFDRPAELADREELRTLAILYPGELERELAQLKSAEERSVEALAQFAILQPAAYAARYGLTNAAAGFDPLQDQSGRGAGSAPDRERLEVQAALERPDPQALPPPMRPSENPKP